MPLMTPSRPPVSTASSSSSRSIKTIARATYPMLGVHRGAIDQTMITNGSPPEAMKRILSVLENMGIVVEAEHEYRYRCTRPRRHADFEDLSMASILGSSNCHSKGVMSGTRPSRARETHSPARHSDLGLEEDFEKSFTADFVSITVALRCVFCDNMFSPPFVVIGTCGRTQRGTSETCLFQ